MKTQNNSSEALQWWNDLTFRMQLVLVCKYLSDARMPGTVSKEEIERMWYIETHTRED